MRANQSMFVIRGYCVLLHLQRPPVQMVRVQLERLVQILFAIAHIGRVVVTPAFIVE
jgi:hypothetical protein